MGSQAMSPSCFSGRAEPAGPHLSLVCAQAPCPQHGRSALPHVAAMFLLLAGIWQAGVKGCPIASGEGWWQRAQGLVLCPGNKCLSSAGCVEAAAARGQWCGSGPLSQLSVQLCPSRLRGLLLYLLSCVGVQS